MLTKQDTLAPNSGSLQPPRSPRSHSLALPGKTQTRKPAAEWNNADDLDDGRDDALELSDEEKEIATAGECVQKKSPSGGQVIDLLDIARPAKPKGGVSL